MNMMSLPSLKQITRPGNALPFWKRLVAQIMRRGTTLRSLDDLELRRHSLSLRYRALSGESLNELLVEAYALGREAARRTIDMYHYDVQLLGGIAMHFGSIAVMQTGEGKTLTASLPLYLHALTQQGAHLVTANDYLAARDAEWMQPVYNALGLTVGIVQSNSSRAQRQSAYLADITYSTAKEIGFDFLRDRLSGQRQHQGDVKFIDDMIGNTGCRSRSSVQRDPNFMIVDEADSILIDEARTPLIISSLSEDTDEPMGELCRWSADVCREFRAGQHYELLPDSRQLHLTADGRRRVRELGKPERLNRFPITKLYERIEIAIYVDIHYQRDRHYIIRNGEIVIVDEFSGRLADGRKWRDGIHQAIEAREHIDLSSETGEAARITVQDLFLRYPKLAGMTGTVGHAAAELRKIYRLETVRIPTNRPSQRKRWDDLVFGTEDQKWEAIADEVEAVRKSGRCVLIGTRSIDKSEKLSRLLIQRGIPHEVLNARQLALEAKIVSAAGKPGQVTVATNMAGRGTDIKVDPAALQAGGLHVICSELHQSSRIDRQLIGRCGRQGDVGSYRQFMSLEDDILSNGLGKRPAARLKRHAASPPHRLFRLSHRFRQAQRRIERRHFAARKWLLYRENLRRQVQQEMGQDPYLDVAGAS